MPEELPKPLNLSKECHHCHRPIQDDLNAVHKLLEESNQLLKIFHLKMTVGKENIIKLGYHHKVLPNSFYKNMDIILNQIQTIEKNMGKCLLQVVKKNSKH